MSGAVWIAVVSFVGIIIIIILVRRWIMARERTQAEISETCDKACEILIKTNDGDMLDPSDLKLTELAVNGYLNDTGKEVFEQLYLRVVVEDTYKKPYLHDIEHLTRDHEGYIYYKGIHVEHYDRDYVYSEDAKNSLLELKRRCEYLERRSVEVSCGSAVWGWEKYADDYGAERLALLTALLGAYGLRYSMVEVYNSGRDNKYFVLGTPGDLDEIKNHSVTKSMIGRYFDDEYEITVGNFIYGDKNNLIPPDAIKDKAEIESLLQSCHGYLTKHGALEELPAVIYKTDFAEGYENTKRLDELLNNPGRGLEYSVVDFWGRGSNISRVFAYGAPTLDEVKAYEDYKHMKSAHGVLSVSATTFRYGSGEPLTSAELPPFDKVEVLLSETHDYLIKHDLAQETRWNNFTHDVVVNRALKPEKTYEELEYEDEMGVEL